VYPWRCLKEELDDTTEKGDWDPASRQIGIGIDEGIATSTCNVVFVGRRKLYM
jgi:hypothetical protein